MAVKGSRIHPSLNLFPRLSSFPFFFHTFGRMFLLKKCPKVGWKKKRKRRSHYDWLPVTGMRFQNGEPIIGLLSFPGVCPTGSFFSFLFRRANTQEREDPKRRDLQPPLEKRSVLSGGWMLGLFFISFFQIYQLAGKKNVRKEKILPADSQGLYLLFLFFLSERV